MWQYLKTRLFTRDAGFASWDERRRFEGPSRDLQMLMHLMQGPKF